jgi:hypothetical protein
MNRDPLLVRAFYALDAPFKIIVYAAIAWFAFAIWHAFGY